MSEYSTSTPPDSELLLLERVQEASAGQDRLTQRELARASGLSLGMTNILVRRLVERGLLSLKRHSAKSISYLLTPEGAAEIARRTAGYFSRASKLAYAHGERIEAFVIEAKRRGSTGVVLVGSSSADFILERVCEIHGLVFMKSADPERWLGPAKRPGLAVVWGERGRGSRAGLAQDPASLDLALLISKEAAGAQRS